MIASRFNAEEIYENNPQLITSLPGHTLSERYGFRSEYEQFVTAAAASVIFPGIGSQIRGLPLLLRGRLSAVSAGMLYGPVVFGIPTLSGMALQLLLNNRSPRQDMTSVTKTGQIPRTRGGTRSSRAAKSAPSTVKPFWSNGKPKCREGYRYDFKRKMCVKKS